MQAVIEMGWYMLISHAGTSFCSEFHASILQ
jgi:hypothetical protein